MLLNFRATLLGRYKIVVAPRAFPSTGLITFFVFPEWVSTFRKIPSKGRELSKEKK